MVGTTPNARCAPGGFAHPTHLLELASDNLHDGVGRVVALPRCQRPLGGDDSAGSFIQAQQLPADRLIANASAGNLPDPHDGVIVFREADSVNLNIAGVTVVLKLKNVT
jgi:hypothetical protein